MPLEYGVQPFHMNDLPGAKASTVLQRKKGPTQDHDTTRRESCSTDGRNAIESHEQWEFQIDGKSLAAAFYQQSRYNIKAAEKTDEKKVLLVDNAFSSLDKPLMFAVVKREAMK